LDLSQGNYVARTLKKIAEGKPYEEPTNKQLLDIVCIDDVARAFYSIGISGKNKADYYIGTSTPATLGQYFEMFERVVNSNFSGEIDIAPANRLGRRNIEELYLDTGFVATTRFQDMIKKLQNQ
jgi:nucleoside-diphosphate-sugar epimerase